MEPMEKLKKYNEFTCNELNLFLKIKDEEFFQDVVLPHLKCKKEKQLIDYYLLDDDVNLKRFMNLSAVYQLNKLEQVLLI